MHADHAQRGSKTRHCLRVRRASHTVEWAESTAIKLQRTARGPRQEETTTVVNFAEDQVLNCSPNTRE